jgi:ribonucleoside-diphosphate reductase alpha chain
VRVTLTGQKEPIQGILVRTDGKSGRIYVRTEPGAPPRVFAEKDIAKIEKALPSVFELPFAFNVWTLGEDALTRLGLTKSQWSKPGFNLLRAIGFTQQQIDEANDVVCGMQTIEGAPHLKDKHLPVFDCANTCGKHGKRYIHYMGHVRMMAAAQPFLSGAISKTVNLPETATVEDVEDVYLQSWKLGLKATAIYRDNAKVGQPLADQKSQDSSTSVVEEASEASRLETVEVHKPFRKRLPKSRASRTTSFTVGGAEGYMTSGAHEDGELGEIFLKLGKQGSTLAGVMDAFSIAVSIGLQYGVPLETYVSKFTNLRFEPAGLTDDADIRMAQSVMDYVFRRLALDYLDFETREGLGIYSADERQRYLETGSYEPVPETGNTSAELIEIDLSSKDM